MSKFINESWLVVTMAAVFACLLAGTQTSLSSLIEKNKTKALNEAIVEVVPDTATSEKQVIDGNDVYRCLDKDGTPVGWAVRASGTGFMDKIVLVVGLTPDGAKVTGVKVIEDVETPGLGNKIEGEWANQYRGQSTERPFVVIKGTANKANNEIEAITGATYSSSYTTDIVNDVLERIRPQLGKDKQ